MDSYMCGATSRVGIDISQVRGLLASHRATHETPLNPINPKP